MFLSVHLQYEWFDFGLMWQWGVVSGSVWIERQLWLALQLQEDMYTYVTMQEATVMGTVCLL